MPELARPFPKQSAEQSWMLPSESERNLGLSSVAGKKKPETASVRIREDSFSVIYSVAKEHGVKQVDIVDAMVYCWRNYTTGMDKKKIVERVMK